MSSPSLHTGDDARLDSGPIYGATQLGNDPPVGGSFHLCSHLGILQQAFASNALRPLFVAAGEW